MARSVKTAKISNEGNVAAAAASAAWRLSKSYEGMKMAWRNGVGEYQDA